MADSRMSNLECRMSNVECRISNVDHGADRELGEGRMSNAGGRTPPESPLSCAPGSRIHSEGVQGGNLIDALCDLVPLLEEERGLGERF
jgi:hypothetical protein